MKQMITSDKIPPPPGPFSPGLVVGDLIFLSGQGGFASDGALVGDDFAAQTKQTFRNIETLLEAAGASLEDIVSCLVHLTDLDNFAEFNTIYEGHFTRLKPVRTTVRADLSGGMQVEITVIAARPKRGRAAGGS
jgi:2-iminobutanoate/2-iminopropanoate deaminase